MEKSGWQAEDLDPSSALLWTSVSPAVHWEGDRNPCLTRAPPRGEVVVGGGVGSPGWKDLSSSQIHFQKLLAPPPPCPTHTLDETPR